MEEWDIVIKEAVSALGKSFDTHDVIKKIAHLNQREYVLALSELDSDTPFHKLHSALGLRIKPVCEQLGYVGKDSRSPDMFGQSSRCKQWSR